MPAFAFATLGTEVSYPFVALIMIYGDSSNYKKTYGGNDFETETGEFGRI